MPGENVWNKRVEVGGQKWEPKVRGQNESLKESSFFSLLFFSLCFFFLLLEKKKMQGENIWNKREKMGRQNGSQKWEGRVGVWRKTSSFFAFLFFSMVFFSFLFFEKKKMLRIFFWKIRLKAGTKSERAEWEFESKFPPFSWFFLLFLCVFCLLCVWEEENNGNVSSSSFVVVL